MLSKHPAVWGGKLGAPNQWRNVPYVDDLGDGFFMCQLCGTGKMHQNNCHGHFHGSKHTKAYNRVILYENEAMKRDTAATVEFLGKVAPSVESLGSRAWIDEIKALMFDLMILTSRNYADYESLDLELMKLKIARLSLQYLEKETRALLELALWKASITNGFVFESVQEAREYSASDEVSLDSQGYVSRKRIVTSRSKIVVSLVMSFL